MNGMSETSEVLRRAAGLMRERAEAATPGPWEILWNAVAYIDTVADPGDPTGQTPMQSPEKVADAGERDRVHIASWHPAVALAVADWLDLVARLLDEGFDANAETHAALTVARAYLGADQ